MELMTEAEKPENLQRVLSLAEMNMKKIASISMIVILILSICSVGFSLQSTASITVNVNNPLGEIDPTIYGHFTELTLSSFEGSIWSELLFNLKF